MMIALVILFAFLSLLIIGLSIRSLKKPNTIAFFHPYCSSGGGGERVLWHIIEVLLTKYPYKKIYIYSHSNIKSSDKLNILQKVKDLFKIDLLFDDKHLVDQIEFIPLTSSILIEAKQYPLLTLLSQSIGSVFSALEAAVRLTPEVYFETTGFAFTLPIFKILSCKVITYVHYPTISTDMIESVQLASHASYNNRGVFTKYKSLKKLKLIYYRCLVFLYGIAGRRSDLVMVNSSWTRNHIDKLWSIKSNVVYPPCDIESFNKVNELRNKEAVDEERSPKSLNIVSIAQFRPEKNHQLQIEAFDSFLNHTKAYDSKLVLFGGVRDLNDKLRVDHLRECLSRLELTCNVQIIVEAPFGNLLDGMKDGQVAIHTMENEHFGIVLVECMAAGLICIAHKSGGPESDIIDHGENGFLASNLEEFTKSLVKISEMSQNQRNLISKKAIMKARNFGIDVFRQSLLKLIDGLLLK